MYKVLYRKWRPAKFSEIIGQEHISKTIKSEVLTGNISHAYLFVGSRGTGKTTTAKILAKALNCLNLQNGEPCCACSVCTGIDSGSILDVLEIDAASSTGVDNIRLLKEDAKFAPTVGKFRIYIIDEAHMLSTGAFNALLKIMEDPPENVVFILATTQVNKVPPTVLSRCQRFDFLRLSSQRLKERIIDVANNENISISEEGAMLIAVLADGGVRDALSLLDVCNSVSGGELIDEETVEKVAALPTGSVCLDLISFVSQKKLEDSLRVIEGCHLKSVDMINLFSVIIKTYRNILLLKLCENIDGLLEIPQKDLRKSQDLAKELTVEEILTNIDVFKAAYSNLAKAANHKMELELCVIKLCCLANPVLDSVDCNLKQWSNILRHLSKINPMLGSTLIGSVAYLKDDVILIDSKSALFLDLVRNNEQAKESLKTAISVVLGKKYRIGPYNKHDFV
ncbi:MAG: DNA polymerase III subunit gamma/tau [Oscillospiraceae bacterium]|jgi:DNA polymerase-3 subunit gamma/tau|nr:DNA polymerase III subunit gamma/tau [Oscillospiraceae bacterium]